MKKDETIKRWEPDGKCTKCMKGDNIRIRARGKWFFVGNISFFEKYHPLREEKCPKCYWQDFFRPLWKRFLQIMGHAPRKELDM